MNRVLILGDGLLGSEIEKQTGWDIVSKKKNGIDLTRLSSLEPYLVNYIEDETYGLLGWAVKYDIVINCIADTDTYSTSAENHIAVNYLGTAELAKACNKFNIKLVHISSEYVYANNKGRPSESDIPNPSTNWYSLTKLLGDFYIEKTLNNFLICRLLHKEKSLYYDKVWDVRTTGDSVDKIAKIVIELVRKDAKGIYNVGTGDKALKDIIDHSTVIEPPNFVPKDTRMNINKLIKFLKE